MATFDLVILGGTVIDGTGGPARRADVGVLGDRIAAVGDLAAVDLTGIPTVLDVAGRVVSPGFIDPHGHSDGSVLVDGALASHLHQGFTTQLSGNCGDSLAPITDRGRELVDLSLRQNGLTATWESFAGYLDRVDANRSGRTSRSSSGTGRSAGRRSVPTPGRRQPRRSPRWPPRSKRHSTPAPSASRPD